LFPQSFLRPSAAVVRALALTVLLCLSGCRSSTPKVEVFGKVTCEGKPVSEGRISFMNPDTGVADEALLQSDGNYSLATPLPPGEYKVMVMPLIVRRQVEGKGPEVGVEKAAPDIPEKYRVIGTTDLKATVKEGPNELNFDMKR
jgi:hypothetical protein